MVKRFYKDKSFYYSDPEYSDYYVAKLVNFVMRRGKKTTAQKIVYEAIEKSADKLKMKPRDIIKTAVQNVAPVVEVRPKRVGGRIYQVPFEVNPDRQVTLAMRWLIEFAKSRKGVPMAEKLAAELIDAVNQQGNAMKKREGIHKTAAANRAYAHFARY